MKKRKIIWLLISCLMVVALLVTSCGGDDTDDGVVDGDGDGVVDGDGDDDGIIEDGTGIDDDIETVIDSLGREVEKPRYGGSFNYSRTTDIRGFDDVIGGYQTSFSCGNVLSRMEAEHGHITKRTYFFAFVLGTKRMTAVSNKSKAVFFSNFFQRIVIARMPRVIHSDNRSSSCGNFFF